MTRFVIGHRFSINRTYKSIFFKFVKKIKFKKKSKNIAPKLLDFFAGPAITLSMAYSKSDLSTFECWTLAACNAASFTKFDKSAPRNERKNIQSNIFLLKVSKYRKQNTKFSYPPKIQQNFVH